MEIPISGNLILAELALAALLGAVGWLFLFVRRMDKHIRTEVHGPASVTNPGPDVSEQLNRLRLHVEHIETIVTRELSPNKGTSLRDRVVAIEAWLAARENRPGKGHDDKS